jgi:flagellar L-ring protein precursor FlgH
MTSMAKADSLFPGSSTAVKTGGKSVSLYADSKAYAVGDSLTIIVTETAAASSTAATTTSKTETDSAGPGLGQILSNFSTLGFSGAVGSNASGTTTRADSLTAQIQVTITKILPNGNFSIEGKRRVGMNAETQEITLTGVVRPDDITSSNTVASPLVADAQIKFSGKGPVGDKQREGFFTKLFKLLF